MLMPLGAFRDMLKDRGQRWPSERRKWGTDGKPPQKSPIIWADTEDHSLAVIHWPQFLALRYHLTTLEHPQA